MRFPNEIVNDDIEFVTSSCPEFGQIIATVRINKTGNYLLVGGQPASFGRKGFLVSGLFFPEKHYNWTWVSGKAGESVVCRIGFTPKPSSWDHSYKWALRRFSEVNSIPSSKSIASYSWWILIGFPGLITALGYLVVTMVKK
jgi:hypothetical protein